MRPPSAARTAPLALLLAACAQERTIVGYGTPPVDTTATGAPRVDYASARLAFTTSSSGRAAVVVAAADGSGSRTLPIGGDSVAVDLGIAWSPDGNRLLYTRHAARGVAMGVRVFDLRTGEVTTMVPQLAGGQQPTWAPTGARVAYVVPMGGGVDHVRVMDYGRSMDSTLAVDAREPAWGPDTRVAYTTRPGGAAGEPYAVVVRDMASGAVTRASPADGAAYGYAAWSPDGRLAMVRRATPPSATYSLVVVQPSTGEARTLLASETPLRWPSWSPDGATIAFSWETGGRPGVWSIDAGGESGAQPIATGDGTTREAPRWRPGSR